MWPCVQTWQVSHRRLLHAVELDYSIVLELYASDSPLNLCSSPVHHLKVYRVMKYMHTKRLANRLQAADPPIGPPSNYIFFGPSFLSE